MNPHLWLAFVATSAVIGLAPGPAVTSIVGYALSSGRATALAAVAGAAREHCSEERAEIDQGVECHWGWNRGERQEWSHERPLEDEHGCSSVG